MGAAAGIPTRLVAAIDSLGNRLERAAQIEPGYGEAQYQLGLALTRAGRTAEAAERLRAGRELIAAARIDQTVQLDMAEGKAALDRGAVDQALAKFRQALREKPGLAEAHYQLGLALAKKGDSPASQPARPLAAPMPTYK